MSRLCATHSSALLEMVKRKGMGRYITQSTDSVRRKTKLWLTGQAQPYDFDPYIVAALEVAKKAREMYGVQNGTCPLCAADHFLGFGAASTWIDNVTDLMVVTCQANDLRVGD